MKQRNRRLPGFRFEAVAPAREEVLPRMDIALFVGFAAAGPIGIPVALESPAQFETIFGGDLPLVWDNENGEQLYAYLAPAVRGFFRNGGNRCWVLRVARLEAHREKPLNRACYNHFSLSGIALLYSENNKISGLSPAFARARAKGSWSDDLLSAATVISKPVGILAFEDSGEEKKGALELAANETVAAGDLLKFSYRKEKLSLLVAIDEISDEIKLPAMKPPAFGKRIVKFRASRFIWLARLTDEIKPDESYKVRVKIWHGQNKAADPGDPHELSSEHAAVFRLQKDDRNDVAQKVRLEFANLPAAKLPAIGSLLFTNLRKNTIGLQVREIIFAGAENSKGAALICRAVGCRRTIAKPSPPPSAALLRFEIFLKKGNQNQEKISDLSFNPGHERFWGNLPTDDQRYRLTDDDLENIPQWKPRAAEANFPLAGAARRGGFYFPLFAAALPEDYLGAVPLRGTKLQRDGLEQFDADLFLDRGLKKTGTGNLLNEAEFIRYLGAKPRSLWGIHAALVPETVSKIAVESSPVNSSYANYSLDECTIVAVPDAVHRGWSQSAENGAILSPPPVSAPPLRPEWWRFEDCRRRAIKAVSEPLPGNFLDCGVRVIPAPKNLRLKNENISSGKFTIAWDAATADTGLEFVLEESATEGFEFSVEIYRGKAKSFDVSGRRAGIYFYRVRSEDGRNFSDWSQGLAIKLPAAENWTLEPAKNFKSDVLLAVQRALLRMCAARGDLFAVLNLPGHFEESEAFAHIAALKTTKGAIKAAAGVEPLSADEARVLSFGAAYHPWLLTRDEKLAAVRIVPPDGAVCGVMAKRSDERGAWIAPANEVLRGVFGLAKDVRHENFLDFQDNAINLVRQEPRGFLVLDSSTLSDDADLRPINVRRLLSLLRRLAIKHGAEYVFEPNNERFRRQVERGFTALLDLLFARGAFAGTTPASSFQVAVSGAVNNFQSLEQGRFIVELRVAPSLPLKFVTVRLVNAGGRSNVTEVF